MGGGLMQLVAYGAQDVYLTGNPQITFSKLSTEDTQTFRRSMNKLSTVLPISVELLLLLLAETVIY